MGLSIHYTGRLKEANLLPLLIDEVKDVAELYKWKYRVFETKFPDNVFSSEQSFENVYGICFTPTGSETVFLNFISNGRIICPVKIDIFNNAEGREYIFVNSVKTQYAGVGIHQLLIDFFKYLSPKYFENFELRDESYYWETGDENQLKAQFKRYNSIVDGFSTALEVFPIERDEDFETYIKRLAEYVNKRNPPSEENT